MSDRKHTCRPRLESLEDRSVPAGGLTGTISNTGVLTIYGTAGNDAIAIRQSGTSVTVDGFSNVFNANQLSRIQVYAGAGNDTVTLSLSQQMADKVFADGGSGFDTLYYAGNPRSATGFEGYGRIPLPNTSDRGVIGYDDSQPKGGSSTPYNPVTYWIAHYWKHGKWGGLNNAPAEGKGLEVVMRQISFNQLEQLAVVLISHDYSTYHYDDLVDKAFMMHDLRLMWLRENVNKNLTYSSSSAYVQYVNQQLISELRQAQLYYSPTSREYKAADEAIWAFSRL